MRERPVVESTACERLPFEVAAWHERCSELAARTQAQYQVSQAHAQSRIARALAAMLRQQELTLRATRDAEVGEHSAVRDLQLEQIKLSALRDALRCARLTLVRMRASAFRAVRHATALAALPESSRPIAAVG